jgi:hypothetical protein
MGYAFVAKREIRNVLPMKTGRIIGTQREINRRNRDSRQINK